MKNKPYFKHNKEISDRINRILTYEDLQKLRELHLKLSKYDYDLADDVEHLKCYLHKGHDVVCSLPVKGYDVSIVVKPELRLEAKPGEEQKLKQKINSDYSYDSGPLNSVKKEIDEEYFQKRKEFVEQIDNEEIERKEVLDFEIKLRNKDVRDHQYFLTQETQRKENNLYGKLDIYGDKDGIFLTIAAAHWIKEQGNYREDTSFYERAKEHYNLLGIDFEWNSNMEEAVVLETKNGNIKHYPILLDELLSNEGFSAQEEIAKEGEKRNNDIGFIEEASMVYREKEDELRKEGVETDTGIFVVPSTHKSYD